MSTRRGAPTENPVAYGDGAEANPSGDPMGGRAGYSRILASGEYTVGTREELFLEPRARRACVRVPHRHVEGAR
ncbi:MAG: hypothetical protein PVH68_16835 [Armatimonadota bacterium]|jgi:hypothetical protein